MAIGDAHAVVNWSPTRELTRASRSVKILILVALFLTSVLAAFELAWQIRIFPGLLDAMTLPPIHPLSSVRNKTPSPPSPQASSNSPPSRQASSSQEVPERQVTPNPPEQDRYYLDKKNLDKLDEMVRQVMDRQNERDKRWNASLKEYKETMEKVDAQLPRRRRSGRTSQEPTPVTR